MDRYPAVATESSQVRQAPSAETGEGRVLQKAVNAIVRTNGNFSDMDLHALSHDARTLLCLLLDARRAGIYSLAVWASSLDGAPKSRTADTD